MNICFANALLGMAILFPAVASSAQQIDLGLQTAPSAKRQHVELLSDAFEIQAGRPQTIEVRFRVDTGFHINSHQPKDELLIPTVLKLEDAPGLKVLSDSYPLGTSFKVNVGSAGELLDVYQGEFRVQLRLTATKGVSALKGTLRYQACDSAACFPPRNLPVDLTLTAK